MEAVLFDKNAKPALKFVKDKEIPKPIGDHDVIVKVAYAGVCGTDIHIMHGQFPCTDKFPLIMGHEFSGTVIETGPKTAFKKGQRVAVDPNSACDLCKGCRSGNYHHCDKGGKDKNYGLFADGGWAQYCRVTDTSVYEIPENVTFEQAALCEPISCLSHGWDRIIPVPVGQKILIIGAGIIGNLWAVLMHLQGHRNVVVVESNAKRLSLAQKMDLGYKYMSSDGLKKSGQLFDLIIDCTGVAKVLEYNFEYLDDGAKYVVFGCCNPDDTARINPFLMYKKELTILAMKINPFSFPKAIGFISSLGERYLNYEKLGIVTFGLHQFQEAMDQLKTGAIAKAVFKI